MKKISTLSHAKAVHAVKSIGKVLLPVALLLAAILCIGVCASAAAPTYTPSNDFPGYHYVNNDPTLREACTIVGPECSTAGVCQFCGQVGTKAKSGDHTWANVVAAKYLKKAGKCDAENEYYKSCTECGAVDPETFKGAEGVVPAKHNYNQQGTLVPKGDGDCNVLKQYKGKCACGAESDSENDYIVDTVTYGHNAENVQNFNGTLTPEMTAAKLSVADLAVNGSLCGLASEYYDFCTECGDVLTSKTTYNADSPEALAALIAAIHNTSGTYIVRSYNDDAHWTVCTACNTIVVSAKHSFSVADKDVTCANPQACACGFVAKTVDHKYQYHAAVDATCDTNGNKAYYTCSECGGVFDSERKATTLDNVTVKATGHKQADENAPLCNPGLCSVCGKQIKASADHVYDSTKDANYPLGKDGKPVKTGEYSCTAACKECGAVTGKHFYVAKQTEDKSACEKGYATWSQCSYCGDIRNYVENKETSHVYPALGTYPCLAWVECSACKGSFLTMHKLPDNFEYDCTQPLKVVCVNCKNVFTEAKNTYNTGHDNVWVAAVAATCTTDGHTAGYKCRHTITINSGSEWEQTLECKAGGDIKTVKKTGHDWGDYVVTREATCVISGQKNRQCKTCGAWDKVTDTGVDATAHKWSADYRTTPDNNSHYHYCINIDLSGKQCGEAGAAEKHAYYVTVDGKKVAVTEADCRGEAVCVCGKKLAAGNCSTETKFDSANHWKQCKVCGKITDKVAHTVVTVDAKQATCGAEGYDSHLACSCGYAPQEYTKYPATGAHDWTVWVYASKANSTENKDGNDKNSYHVRVCVNCQKKESHKSASDKAANCVYPNRCTECKLPVLDKNGKLEQAALGHDLKGVKTVVTESTHSVTCKRCNETIVEAHKLPQGAPACVDNKCAVCDYVIKATGKHTAPAVDKVVTASGHGFECVDCGKTVTEAHIYNIQVVDCTADIKCTVCGFVVAEGYKTHDVDFSDLVDAVAPTCTTAGHSAGFKCTRCQYVYGGAILPATGHSFQLVAGKAATETEDGYTQHFACTECGATEGKEVLPKTGASVLKGDFNADGKVSSDDAIALLKLIMFGGEADQSLDYDGDGKADSADAIALLKAAMFG